MVQKESVCQYFKNYHSLPKSTIVPHQTVSTLLLGKTLLYRWTGHSIHCIFTVDNRTAKQQIHSDKPSWMAAVYSCPLWLTKPEFKPECHFQHSECHFQHLEGLYLTQKTENSLQYHPPIYKSMMGPHSYSVRCASGHLFKFLLWIPLSFPLGICTLSEKTQGRDTECLMTGKSLKKALTSPVWKIAMSAKTALLISYNHFRMTPWRSHSIKVKIINYGK